ncbi:SHOCT domain-containing protein [Chloroflexota bacterium]
MDKNLKIGLIVGGIVVAVLVILPLIVGLATGWGETCEYEMEEHGMMGLGMMGGFGFGWFMPIGWIVILGLIVWAVIALTKGAVSTGSQGSPKQLSALEVLKDRYARGEIGKEEFEEKRKDLM